MYTAGMRQGYRSCQPESDPTSVEIESSAEVAAHTFLDFSSANYSALVRYVHLVTTSPQ